MRRIAGAAIAAVSLGSVLAAALAWFGLPQHAAATATAPVWTEIAWPFPTDPWGKGKAFRCKTADCGAEVNIYLRAKLGFGYRAQRDRVPQRQYGDALGRDHAWPLM
jgi:hypothetical protein